MKSFRNMFRSYAVVVVAAIFLSAVAHAAPNKAIIRAIREGSAEFSKDKGKTWSKASVGTVLAANYEIRTDANATADLFLGDNGPVVRVTKGTTLGIDRLDVQATGIENVIDTQLDLKNGRILGNVKKMAAASKYEVKTPVGVAGIRGTEYSISSSGEVNVVSGSVIVVYIVNGQPTVPVTLQGGQGIATQPTSATTPAQVVSIQQTTTGQQTAQEVTTVIIGVTTTPQGTMQATLENPTTPGAQTIVTVGESGQVIAPPAGTTVTLNTQTGQAAYVNTTTTPSTTPPTTIIVPPTQPETILPQPVVSENPNRIPGDLSAILPR
jgi:hypothetical protein